MLDIRSWIIDIRYWILDIDIDRDVNIDIDKGMVQTWA